MGWETLIGLAATAAGAGMQASAASSEQDAMNAQVAQELQRQQQFQQQARAQYTQNEQNSTPQAAAQQQQQGVQQSLGAMQAAKLPGLDLPQNQAGNLSDVAQQGETGVQQQNAANWAGYGNVGQQQNLGNIDTGAMLRLISGNAGQWAGILPLQLQQAQQSQSGLATAGSLVNTLGNLAAMYGASGGFGATPAAGGTGVYNWANPNGSMPVNNNTGF